MLKQDRVCIYAYYIPQYPLPEQIEQFKYFLNPMELMKYERYQTAKKKVEYLLSRIALKKILSTWAGTSISDICFETNAFGKPYLRLPAGDAPSDSVRFNLSHSDQIIVCAVALNREIGVDAQKVKSSAFAAPIAKKFFSKKESDYICSFRGDERKREFTRIWTRKEAYVKAVGQGLTLPLNQFDVLSDDPYPRKGWLFHTFEYRKDHFITVVVEHEKTQSVAFEFIDDEIGIAGAFSCPVTVVPL